MPSKKPPSKKPPVAPNATLVLPKAPLRLSAEALFRHGVISQVLGRELGGEPRDAVIRDVVSRSHRGADGARCSTSRRTVYRWLRAFAAGGVAALEPAPRNKIATSEVLSEPFVEFLRTEKGLDASASVPELIRRAREDGVLAEDARVDRVSAWRACLRMGLPLGQRSTKKDRDSRRFAYPNRMMMLLCDGKYFRAGIGRARRLALFYIDDATRYALSVVVGTDGESSELFLRGFYDLLRSVGLADVFFLDNGPGFISDDTRAVVTRFGHLVLGTAGYPEGHGKIERFHQTAWSGVLRGLCRPEIDPAPHALELRLRHFLFEQYNCRPHESLDGQTPQQRWDSDPRALRLPECDAALREKFVITETRKVSADHILSMDGVHYEVPRGHGATRITVYRHMLDATLSILHQGRLVRLHPVDLAANAAARRGKPGAAHDQDLAPAPRTAAMRAFDRSFGPVVGPDGGFIEPVRDDHEED